MAKKHDNPPATSGEDFFIARTPVAFAFITLLATFAKYLSVEGVSHVTVDRIAITGSHGDADAETFFEELVGALSTVSNLEAYHAEDMALRAIAIQLHYVINIEDNLDRSFLYWEILSNLNLFIVNGEYPLACMVRRLQMCFVSLFEGMGQIEAYGGLSGCGDFGDDAPFAA